MEYQAIFSPHVAGRRGLKRRLGHGLRLSTADEHAGRMSGKTPRVLKIPPENCAIMEKQAYFSPDRAPKEHDV
ncbi:MAG: hypothetical protein JW818_11725 [Pirellulales bacterium]|nr:hypothetical protein [Pirellulales bacterium]